MGLISLRDRVRGCGTGEGLSGFGVGVGVCPGCKGCRSVGHTILVNAGPAGAVNTLEIRISVIGTLPGLDTSKVYDTTSPAKTSSDGVTRVTTASSERRAITGTALTEGSDTVRARETPSEDVAGCPDTVALLTICPLSASARVTVYGSAVHLIVWPGRKG